MYNSRRILATQAMSFDSEPSYFQRDVSFLKQEITGKILWNMEYYGKTTVFVDRFKRRLG
jgi:hypothetical protein